MLIGVFAAGCGAAPAPPSAGVGAPRVQAALAIDLARTRPLGRGPAFRLSPLAARVAGARPVAGMTCAAPGPGYGAHLELFADDRVLPVPAGIGWAPPTRMGGGRIGGGRCAYPLRTDDPTGVVVVDPRRAPGATLGELFAIWGQRLDAHHVAGFTSGTAVRAFLGGRLWPGSPRRIPLSRHAQVELEIGGAVAPHPSYAFPAGR